MFTLGINAAFHDPAACLVLPGAHGAAAWVAVTAALCARRLSGTSHRPDHVAEMLLTSALIPPWALFWQLLGAVKYRVLFF